VWSLVFLFTILTLLFFRELPYLSSLRHSPPDEAEIPEHVVRRTPQPSATPLARPSPTQARAILPTAAPTPRPLVLLGDPIETTPACEKAHRPRNFKTFGRLGVLELVRAKKEFVTKYEPINGCLATGSQVYFVGRDWFKEKIGMNY